MIKLAMSILLLYLEVVILLIRLARRLCPYKNFFNLHTKCCHRAIQKPFISVMYIFSSRSSCKKKKKKKKDYFYIEVCKLKITLGNQSQQNLNGSLTRENLIVINLFLLHIAFSHILSLIVKDS